MAGIKDVYIDLKNKLTATGHFKFVHIWNNQLQQLEDGSTYSFPLPCALIEIAAPTEYVPLGGGYSQGELIIKIHIGHEEYDTTDGNFEENVNVFTLRDAVIAALTNYQPVACSDMMKSSEQQDFVHTNVYHYIIDWRTAFIDDKGVPGTITDLVTQLTLDVSTTNEMNEQILTVNQGKAYSTGVTATADGQTDFFVLDQNGNMITGANIVNVVKEIKGIAPNQYTWNATTSHIVLIGGLSCVTGETLFIIYQQNL